ncbi:hypothetical protein EB815_12755 [Mesorhizobium loti]|nr:hypothetical protein EB815_12755 [Mesorhizobium loti]QKC92190.1 hypothetical protein EB230_30170 [Mesorhizobium sp. NZP2234]
MQPRQGSCDRSSCRSPPQGGRLDATSAFANRQRRRQGRPCYAEIRSITAPQLESFSSSRSKPRSR